MAWRAFMKPKVMPGSLLIQSGNYPSSEINLDISEGKNPAEVKRGKKAELTFADLFTEYLKRHSKPNKRTLKLSKPKIIPEHDNDEALLTDFGVIKEALTLTIQLVVA